MNNSTINIGTPLSSTACRVLLLGAGELDKEVVIELRRFGIKVIAGYICVRKFLGLNEVTEQD